MNKIKSIYYTDNFTKGPSVGENGVKEIVACCIEYGDHVDRSYSVYGEGNILLKAIENVPCVIDYEMVEE